MQTSRCSIEVRVTPAVKGQSLYKFSLERRHDAARIIAHITEHSGQGTLRDSKGAEISPDPEYQLQPRRYYFQLGKTDTSQSCRWWVLPSERHLLDSNGSIGFGRLHLFTVATTFPAAGLITSE